ncbi:MAG: molybdopterin cofactor-binding domain-containing protein, partial [Pseudomonadota bacterium]
ACQSATMRCVDGPCLLSCQTGNQPCDSTTLDCGTNACTTAKIPNTSATAASSGADMNGMATKNACDILRERLIDFAANHYQIPSEQIKFCDGQVQIGNRHITFAELVQQAYMARVQLSATGFYRTPHVYYDRESARGRPFFYFAYGAAISEVAIDTMTGENRLLQVDILHDVGKSLNPAIDKGQIEGGFVQGMGWLTTEELVFSESGHLMTHAPSTYKIPTCSDVPTRFTIDIWEKGYNKSPTIHRSKAVGEPPLMLAISVFHAIADAIASIGNYHHAANLSAPATPEAILRACDAMHHHA